MACDLRKVFAEVFKIKEEYINDDLGVGSISEWDSLGHLTLFMALESRFNVKFTIEEILQNTTYRDIKSLLEKKGVKCL